MNCGFSCSKPRKEKSNQDSCLLVKIAFLCTVFVQTTNRDCGAELLNPTYEYPTVPKPIGHGWCNKDRQLAICWMRGSPAPEVVIEFLSCKCSSVCRVPTCQCLANG